MGTYFLGENVPYKCTPTISDESYGSPYSYKWYINNTFMHAEQQYFQHIYEVIGAYTVKCEVTNNNEKAQSIPSLQTTSTTVTDYIILPTITATIVTPTAGINVLPGVSVTYTGNGESNWTGSELHYAWSFDDSSSQTGQMVSKSWAVGGYRTATLTVTDVINGAYRSTTVTINVLDPTGKTLPYSPMGHGQFLSGDYVYIIGGTSDYNLGKIKISDFTSTYTSEKGSLTPNYDMSPNSSMGYVGKQWATTADGNYAVWAGNSGGVYYHFPDAPSTTDDHLCILNLNTGNLTVMSLATALGTTTARWGILYNTAYWPIVFNPTADNLIMCQFTAISGTVYTFKIDPSTATISGTVYTAGYQYPDWCVMYDNNDIYYVESDYSNNKYRIKKYTFGSGLVSTSSYQTPGSTEYRKVDIFQGDWIKAPNGKFYSCGGRKKNIQLGDHVARCVVMDPSTNTLSHIDLAGYPSVFYQGLYGGRATLMGTKILITGGYGYDPVAGQGVAVPIKKACVINTTNDTCSSTANDMPDYRAFHSQCAISDDIVMITGGMDPSDLAYNNNYGRNKNKNSIWLYSISTNTFYGA